MGTRDICKHLAGAVEHGTVPAIGLDILHGLPNQAMVEVREADVLEAAVVRVNHARELDGALRDGHNVLCGQLGLRVDVAYASELEEVSAKVVPVLRER